MKKYFTYILFAAMAACSLTSCESEDQYEADLLTTGDWQGYLGTYYNDRWGLTGTTYETVMHFKSSGVGATSGRGYEADYDTRSPFRDYFYCGFQWSVVNGRITIIYDDSQWSPVYIYDYHLSSRSFYGYMDDGSRRDIRFDFENVNFGYWSRYENEYFYSRTRSAEAAEEATDEVPYENNGKSICSGAFVR